MLPTQTPTRRVEKFDANRQFVLLKGTRVAGKHVEAGEVFDKSLVDNRRLRQMYEGRWLRMATFEEAPQVEPHTPSPLNKPDFHSLNLDELKLWLQAHNVSHRSRVSKETLLYLADKKWQELVADVVSV